MILLRKSTWLICFTVVSMLLALAAIPADAASFRPMKSSDGAVIATSSYANEIGMQVLRDGGNAIDAAVAVGYALAVVHPTAGNLGGGGFAVIHTANGEDYTLDFRESAPGKASRDMYLDAQGQVIAHLSTTGYLAAGTPGTVAGMSAMLDRFGTKPLAELIAPAIGYAEQGFIVNVYNEESFQGHYDRLNQFASSRKYFLKADGSIYQAGDRLIQKDLGNTLRLIAAYGPQAFYEGPIAKQIARDMAAHNGIITLDDLKKYRPIWRQPVRGNYRGYDIVSMAPPSSGGTHIIQMLNIMEAYPIGDMGHNTAATMNIIAEAMRFAYADRSEYMGDPDFITVPVDQLIDKRYAQNLQARIVPGQATPSDQIRPGLPIHEGNNTTHYSVYDKWGNAVSVTYTINDSFGSAAAINGAGFLLNNEMDDFSVKAGVPNIYGLIGGDANAIQPYKRPLSSMSPTIVLKDGNVFLIVGSPGGSRIITTTLQVISNVIDHQMDIREAVDAPRFHMQWQPDELRTEPRGLNLDSWRKLSKMGYNIVVQPPMGDVNAILVDSEQAVAYIANDPRREF